jgi:hypothetical protein
MITPCCEAAYNTPTNCTTKSIVDAESPAPFGKTMLSGCDSEKSRPLFVPEEQKRI